MHEPSSQYMILGMCRLEASRQKPGKARQGSQAVCVWSWLARVDRQVGTYRTASSYFTRYDNKNPLKRISLVFE